MNIPDDKLYREIIIQTGKWQGTYKIYWNRYIAEQFGITDILNWLNDDIRYVKPLQYIESMDGTCVPILFITRRTDKSREFYFCHFPNMMTYFYRRQGFETFKKRNFYGNIIADRHTLAKVGSSKGTVPKKLFVSYLLSGMNPVTAYSKAFNIYYHPSLASKVVRLMDDKIVKKEIKIIYNQFAQKLNLQFSEEDLINEIKLLVNNCKKGSNTHRENLKFLLEIMGKYNPNGKLSPDVVETQYEELPPADT